MKMTLDEAQDFLHTRYPRLGEIVDDLEGRGLRLIRFSQSELRGRVCGSLKFGALPDDYLIGFALQPSEGEPAAGTRHPALRAAGTG